ncbi:MAG: Na+/H+ antiporter NhaC [Paraglaciecola sp.]|jgi:Na+/H+ antiporter NhaC
MENYGILSIVPPVLSIFLAVFTRSVILSLVAGTFVGAFIINGYNPFFAVVNLMENHIFVQVSNSANNQILVVMLCIGGFVQLIERSGGASAFSTIIVKYISDPKRGQLAAWTAGLSIFFTDSGNALIVGPLFRPIFQKLNICKEKLAYIIDTTAAPVSILVPFIAWGVYIMSLIGNAYAEIGLTDQPYEVLLSVLPYQFYAILSLLAIPMLLSTGKDIGPMAKAQAKYNQSMSKQPLAQENITLEGELINTNSTLATFIVPLAVMLTSLVIFISYFAYTEGVRSIHVNSGICLSYIFASLSCAYMMRRQSKTPYQKSLNHFIRGMEKLISVCFILVLAWSLSSICKELDTGMYLASLIGDSISPSLFPALVFLIGALMSFATGSSYGTFAILMISVVPVAHSLDASLTLTIAAVLSGGLFGDHTSPISDTTVVASMGADCNHIEHVSTQFYYASFVGVMTFIAFIISGFYQSSLVILMMILLQFILITCVMKRFGKANVIYKSNRTDSTLNRSEA